MDAEAKKAARREYQREWIAAKRSKHKELRLVLKVPPPMVERLQKSCPMGTAIEVYAVSLMLRGLSAPVKMDRNGTCPCGSGRKWKKCCGAI